jgi:hypothetical protein
VHAHAHGARKLLDTIVPHVLADADPFDVRRRERSDRARPTAASPTRTTATTNHKNSRHSYCANRIIAKRFCKQTNAYHNYWHPIERRTESIVEENYRVGGHQKSFSHFYSQYR